MFSFENIKNKILGGGSRSVAVKRNIIGSLALKGISILVSLMLVPMTLEYVSVELYGIWLTLSSIIVWLNFFDIGFTLGLKNKLAESIALGDWQRGKALVSTTYFMMLLIFVPLCLILEFFIPLVDWSHFLNVADNYNVEITNAMHILIAYFCLSMITNVLGSVVAAFQKVALSSTFPVIGNILSLVAIFILTRTCPPSLVTLSFAVSSMPIIVVTIATFILYKYKFSNVAPSINAIKISMAKDLFSLGFRFFLIQIQVILIYQTINILISNFGGPEDVAYYNISYKYMSVAMMIFTIILTPLWPAFTDAFAKKDYTWMRNTYRILVKIFCFSATLIIVMLLLSPIVYHIWIGDKMEIPFSMTFVVALYVLFNCWNTLQTTLINGIGKIKLQTYITIFGLLAYFPLAVFLGKIFEAVGVVLAITCIILLYSIIFYTQLNKILTNKANGIWNA